MDNDLKRCVQYIRNTGQRPLRIAAFDDDWEPAGPMIRQRLRDADLIEEWSGGLMLTVKAEDWIKDGQ